MNTSGTSHPSARVSQRKHLSLDRYFVESDALKAIAVGMSDGLTVPFVVAAALFAAGENIGVIVLSCLTVNTVRSIVRGITAYRNAKLQAEHYSTEAELRQRTNVKAGEPAGARQSYGVRRFGSKPFVDRIRRRPQAWANFVMRFRLGLPKPRNSALATAATIAAACFAGGMVPIAP